jgi:hypothetical protein
MDGEALFFRSIPAVSDRETNVPRTLPHGQTAHKMNRLSSPLLLLMVFIVGGCKSNREPTPGIRIEEYAVFSAIIDTVYTTGFVEPVLTTTCLLKESTCLPPETENGGDFIWPYALSMPEKTDSVRTPYGAEIPTRVILNKLQSDLPTLDWPSLLKDFDSVQVYPSRLDSALFQASKHVQLVDSILLQEDSSGWLKIHRLMLRNGAGRYARFSRAGFNNTRDQAIVYYGEAGDGASSGYFALVKKGFHWTVLRGRWSGYM